MLFELWPLQLRRALESKVKWELEPVSRTSRKFSGDINPFVCSVRTHFKLWNLADLYCRNVKYIFHHFAVIGSKLVIFCYIFHFRASNHSLGVGWNKFSIYVVDTTRPTLDNTMAVYSLFVFRERRSEMENTFEKESHHEVCVYHQVSHQ